MSFASSFSNKKITITREEIEEAVKQLIIQKMSNPKDTEFEFHFEWSFGTCYALINDCE